mgnify:CR=1 FL=1
MTLSLILSGNSYAGWFDKDKIKVTDCYDPKKYNSFKQQVKDKGKYDWSWEIDLKKDTAILSFITPDGKLSLVKHIVKIKTDRYIIASDGQTPDVQFDLKNEVYISENTQATVDIFGESSRHVMRQCNFK